MASITTRVIRNARRRGVKVYGRRRWRSKHLAVYQWRRVNRHHKLLPKRSSDTLVQHITVTRDDGSTRIDFFHDMQEVERIGMDRFGSGVSYNFVVDMETGEVGLGQSLDAAGTHTINYAYKPGFSFNQNYVALAIAVLGMPGQHLSDRAERAVANLIAALIDEKALTKDHDYLPHSWFVEGTKHAKDCPTQPIRDVMPHINKVAKRIAKA